MKKISLVLAATLIVTFANITAQSRSPLQGCDAVIAMRTLIGYSNDFGTYEYDCRTGLLSRITTEFSQNTAIPLKGEQMLTYVLQGGQSYAYTKWDIASMPSLSVYRTVRNQEMVDIISGVQDPVSLKVYACISDYNAKCYYWVSINLTDFVITRIATMDKPFAALAADNAGALYAINHDGRYYSVDPATGKGTLIKETGITSTQGFGICATYDAAGDRIIFSRTTGMYAGEDGWYALDRKSGDAARLFNYGGKNSSQWTGMYVRPDRSLRPDKVTNADLAYEYDPFVMKVAFTCPKAPASVADPGKLTYNVIFNTIYMESYSFSGEARWGERMEVPIDVPEDNYTVQVLVESEGGTSEPVMIGNMIQTGAPTPKDPAQGTAAVYENGRFKVTIVPHQNDYIPDDRRNFLVRLYENNDKLVYEQLTGENVYCLEIPWDEPTEHKLYRIDVYGYWYGKLSGVWSLPTIILGPEVYSVPFECIPNDNNQLLTIYGSQSTKKITTTAHANWNRPNSNVDEDWYRVNLSDNNGVMEWLIIMPKLYFEGGKEYCMKVDLACHTKTFLGRPRAGFTFVKATDNINALVAEIRADSSINHNNTREGSQKQLAALFPEGERIAVSATRDEPLRVAYSFTPETSGDYYLALAVDNLGQGTPISASSFWTKGYTIAEQGERNRQPCAPSIEAVADENAAQCATITLTAPKFDADGNTISGSLRSRIYRDEEMIAENLAFNADLKLSYTDNNAPEGDVTYTAVAYNEFGDSPMSEPATCFVGNTVPKALDIINYKIIDGGKVQLTWSKVTEDTNGRPAKGISYNIYRLNSEGETLLATIDAIENTSNYKYTDAEAAEITNQCRIAWKVLAVNDKGVSDMTQTGWIWVGTPYNMPYIDKFDGSPSTPAFEFASSTDPDERLFHWGNTTDEQQHGPDGSSCLGFYSWYPTYYALNYVTGTVHIDEDATNAVLAFDYYAFTDCDHTIDVAISTDNGINFVVLKQNIVTTAQTEGWQKCMLSLAKYAGKDVRVLIAFTPRRIGNRINDMWMYIDNVSIYRAYNHNLKAVNITYEENAIKGTGGTLYVTYENNGLQPAENFMVETLCDNHTFQKPVTIDYAAAATFGTAAINVPAGVENYGKYTVLGRIVNADDEYEADNYSNAIEIEIIEPEWPVVNNLSGSIDEQGNVQLKWSAPNLRNVPIAQDVDSFEGETTAWRFSGSFFKPGETDGYEPHTGNGLIAANISKGTTGWAFSPQLDGSAQTISLYAANTTTSIVEAFEIYTSTGDATASSMKHHTTVWCVPEKWTRYDFDLEEGTKYFAIKYDASLNRIANAIRIDDVSFAPRGGKPIYNLMGYNVYAQTTGISPDKWQLQTPQLGTATKYSETVTPGKAYTYAVSVVYDLGESGLSNIITIDENGIDTISAADAINISAEGGEIIVTGANAVEITDVAGRTLLHTKGYVRHPFAPGLYVVRADSLTAKVMVK